MNSITESLVIDCLTYNSTIIFDADTSIGLFYFVAGTYQIEVVRDTLGDITGINLNNIIESNDPGYFKLASVGTEIPSDQIQTFITDINSDYYNIGSVPFVFDGLGINWNTVSLTSANLWDENQQTIPDGDYLVGKNGPDDITLTKIGPDTDYDDLLELDEQSVYKLYVASDYSEIEYFANLINMDAQSDAISYSSTLNVDYETSATVVTKMSELGDTWNSVTLSDDEYYDVDDSPVSAGTYKVSYDVGANIVSLQPTFDNNGELDLQNTEPYVLSDDSRDLFIEDVNMGPNNGGQQVTLETYKQYFFDLVGNPPTDGSEVIPYLAEAALLNNGTIYKEGETFDETVSNFINTADVISMTPIVAGDGIDYIAGGLGGFEIDGGSGFDLYVASPATIDVVLDQNGEVLAEDGVIIDLSFLDTVTYIDAGTVDQVSNVEYFMGTLGDDLFVGSSLYNSLYNIQSFNPTGGKDEIIGAEDVIDINSDSDATIEVLTAVVYDGMQGGQGVIFILDGSEAATYATADPNELSYQKISEFAGEYWSDTNWAADGWLPSNDDILNENENFSTVSKHLGHGDGVTLILDSFGDTDLAFNIDHYIGSGDADIFFGSTGDDSFDAATGTGNYMSGGSGLDQLTITDYGDKVFEDNNEIKTDDTSDDDIVESGENIDLDTIVINRSYDYDNYHDVTKDSNTGKLEYQEAGSDPTGNLYRIDFVDLSDLSSFYHTHLSTSIPGYSISNEYQLFLRTTQDLNTLPGDFYYDTTNNKIDVTGSADLSLLDGLPGQLVIAEENLGFIISGQQIDDTEYSTVIEGVEQVALLTDDLSYFGTGNISGSQEDIYQLMLGGQGDLGDMLYVATGEKINSTTGVGQPSTVANFISGDIFYSGHHTDFDRNTSHVSNWANSVAFAYADAAKIWNHEVAQFFVWYDADVNDDIDGYEIAVRYQTGDVNAWGIDNNQFDTFQNVTVDQTIANAINTQFGDGLTVELGEYRVLYEAAYTDIETLIGSDADVSKWNFDFQPTSSRSTFYIQVGGDATGDNGSAGISDTLVTNVKVERIGDEQTGFTWNINPQAEILVNLPKLAGADANDNLMISGLFAETIEAGRGSDVMMGRGGSDNYKIVAGDTLDASGNAVDGSYGVAGDVINEIGGSSEDKSDAITLSSAKTIDQVSFSRDQIANEYWDNTLKIEVDYGAGVIDTLYVFDHYNQSQSFRAVEQLFLDDGWDANEIWNLIVGDVNESTKIDEYEGTYGQDVLIAGTTNANLYGGDGKDIMIGDTRSNETTFELGNRVDAWDQIADIIEGFGTGDKLDLTNLGISDITEITANGNELQLADSNNTVIAEFKTFYDGLTLQTILDDSSYIVY